MSLDAPSEPADAIRPQDDLFGHVNGGWLESAVIPSDLSRTGGFVDLSLEAEAEVGEILRAASAEPGTRGDERQKIGDLFASFMDADAVEARGWAPLADDLAAIEALDDVGGLVSLFARLSRDGLAGGAIESYVNTDDRHADQYIVNIVQAGLGLPDESYYREDTFAEIRTAYVAHVAAMLKLIGWSDAAATDGAARVMALETRLAAGHWDRVRNRDVIATYNRMTLSEMAAAAPAFDWRRWIDGLGGSEAAFVEVLVRQPSYLVAMSEAMTEVPLEDWKVWLTFHLVHGASPYLSSPFVEENFSFYSRTLSGTETMRDRWKRGVSLCDRALGEAVGRQYVDRVFPPEAKAQMDDLVANLVEAYRISIGRLDWMGEDTRARALAKLGQFRAKIGYPDRWRDYSGLEIERDDLVGNVRRASAFETDRQLAKIGAPVDLDEWLMTPQTVNAYYNPGVNEICFPAAILRPPFFQSGADPALNYGGIGAVIGHEIGHGFDDQGSRVRRDRQPGGLVDRRGPGQLRRAHREADRPVRRLRTPRRARSPRQRRAHCGREHRGPRRPHHRLVGLPAQPGRHRRAGDRRAHRAPACLLQLGAHLADQDPTRVGAADAVGRSALARRVPGQHRAQPRRVPRGLRHLARRRAVARSGRAGPHLVIPAPSRSSGSNDPFAASGTADVSILTRRQPIGNTAMRHWTRTVS